MTDGWETKPLGQILTLQRGYDLPKSQRRQGAVPIVSSSGPEDVHDVAMHNGPGVITGRYGTIGKVFFVTEPYWPLNTTLFVSDFKGNDPKFCYYLLNRFDFVEHSGKTGVPGVNRNDLHSVQISTTNDPKEQEAIAEALSDADGVIEGLERLIAKKRRIKQGAMQDLLTARRRLPGFSGEWNSFTVREVVTRNFCGPSPTCEERNVSGDEWGVLKTTAITFENGWDWRKHKVLPKSFWGNVKPLIEMGDVIVTKAGPRHRVGVPASVDFVPENILVSGKMIGLRPDAQKVTSLMLASAIASKEAQAFLDQRTTGMAESQVNFNNEDLLSTPILLPSIEEQSAISAIAADFDAEIAALEARLNKARMVKEGMMQNLLTGRVRLV